MRDFLTDKHIVGSVSVWNEGKRLHYVLDNLLQYCDEIAIMMDYPDSETEKIVADYKLKYNERIRYGYTTAPALKNPNNLKRRYKVYQSQIMEDKLKLVKQIHDENSIDILLLPDSDEMFTTELPHILERFMEMPQTSISMKSIDVYDTMDFIHDKGMMSHYRVYKYDPEAHFTPRRYQDFLRPYRGREAWKGYIGGFVHLSQHRDFAEMREKLRNPRLVDVSPNARIWQIGYPPEELGSEQYKTILSTVEPTCLLEDYEKLFAKS